MPLTSCHRQGAKTGCRLSASPAGGPCRKTRPKTETASDFQTTVPPCDTAYVLVLPLASRCEGIQKTRPDESQPQSAALHTRPPDTRENVHQLLNTQFLSVTQHTNFFRNIKPMYARHTPFITCITHRIYQWHIQQQDRNKGNRNYFPTFIVTLTKQIHGVQEKPLQVLLLWSWSGWRPGRGPESWPYLSTLMVLAAGASRLSSTSGSSLKNSW